MPVKREGAHIVKCTRCGYEEAIKRKEEEAYKTVVKGEQKILTTKVVSRRKGLDVRKEEELEQAKDSYYELVLDQMGEYGE